MKVVRFKGLYRESNRFHGIKIKLFLVIWKNIEYNIGNAFDESTGKFTCPHDGIYSFYATSPVYNNDAHIYIYVNGSSKVYHYIYEPSSNYAHSSPHGVFKLKKGDSVHINMSGAFSRAGSECDRTYFQGHLIDLL